MNDIMLRRLIEEHLADDVEAALDWLDRHVTAYESMQELSQLDGGRRG